MSTIRFFQFFLIIILANSCTQSREKDHALYYDERLPYLFRVDGDNEMVYKVPSFVDRDVSNCDFMGDDTFHCFNEWEIAAIQEIYPTANHLIKLKGLKQLTVLTSLIHETESIFWESVETLDNGKKMFFSTGENGEVVFALDDTFDPPTATSMTFLPKYDRELELVFYENDRRTRFYFTEKLSDDVISVTIQKFSVTGGSYEYYHFKPVDL